MMSLQRHHQALTQEIVPYAQHPQLETVHWLVPRFEAQAEA